MFYQKKQHFCQKTNSHQKRPNSIKHCPFNAPYNSHKIAMSCQKYPNVTLFSEGLSKNDQIVTNRAKF